MHFLHPCNGSKLRYFHPKKVPRKPPKSNSNPDQFAPPHSEYVENKDQARPA